MTSEQQPQSATQLVLRAFSLNFRMLPTFVAFGLICYLVPFLLLVAGFAALAERMTAPGIILILISIVLGLIGYAYFYAATVLAVWLRLTGVKAKVFQIVRRLRGRVAWRTITTGLRVGFTIMFGFLLLIVPGLIWYSKYAMAVPVVVVEQVYGRDAMDRSSGLAAGHRGRLVGAVIFFLVLYEVISLSANFGIAPLLIALGAPSESAKIVQGIGSLLVLIILPASMIFPVLMYFDLRVRKEAFTLPAVRDVDDTLAAGVGI